MNKSDLLIARVYREALENLTDEQCGKLIKALLQYQFDGIVPDNLTTELQMAFSFMKSVADKHNAYFQEKCKKNAKAIQGYWDRKRGQE